MTTLTTVRADFDQASTAAGATPMLLNESRVIYPTSVQASLREHYVQFHHARGNGAKGPERSPPRRGYITTLTCWH